MDYELINWKDDDDISAERLNSMDNGIKNANDNLEEKANKEELNNYIPNSQKGITVATLVEGKIPEEQLPNSSDLDVNNINSNVFVNIPDTSTVRNIGSRFTDDTGFAIYFAYNRMGIGKIDSNDTIKIPFFSTIGGGSSVNLASNSTLSGTPSSDDNSTKIATTGYVKAQSASMDTSLLSILNQCYKKDPSGLIHQFVELEATVEEIDVQFPISFPEKCLFVGVEILNPQKDSSVSNIKFETIEKTLDSVKLLKIGTGTPIISVMALGI